MTFNLTSSDRRIVFKIILIYSLFGGLWIYLSDTILGWLVRDPDIITRIATYKGLFFIVITASLLYYLVGRYLSRISQSRRLVAESEERFETIFNGISDAVFVHDALTGRFVHVNQTACDMYGYTRNELLALDVQAISLGTSPYSQKEAVEWMDKASLGEPQTFTWHCRHKDGSLFWTEISMQSVRIVGEQRIVVSVRDISDRISANNCLREKEALLSATIESLPFEFYALDTSGRYIMQNATTWRNWGDVIGKRPEDLPADPSQIKKWMDNNRRALTGEVIQQETVFGPPNNRRNLLAILTPIKDRTGEILGVLGVNIDQTEQKKAEQGLRESEENLRSLLALMPVGVACTTLDGVMEYLNPYFVESFGYTLEEIPTVEEWFLKAYPDREYRESLLKIWAEQFESAKNRGIQIPPRAVRLTCKDGLIRDVIINTQMSQNRLVAILTDITDQETRRNELIKNQKLESIGVLAGGIAHDFNNILTGILGNISFARMFVDDGHKSAKPLYEAEKASKRAAELAQQLLTFARGGQPVTKAVSLQHLLEESVSLVLRGSNVTSSIVIQAGLRAVEADEGQISQVINNLILNAVQAMPGGGTITINAENMNLDGNNVLSIQPGSYVRLQISDQGCGIPQENLKNIFDPYFTTKSGGTGLGLASVHSIVSKHGGYISVRSSQGRGTTFEILLPASTEQPIQPGSSAAAAHVSHRADASILVMDDEEMICDLTSAILGDQGYRVTTCSNGQEAIDLYRAAFQAGVPFQAVIMDLTIPGGMGGKEAAQSILEIDPQACLVVSSGYSHDQIVANYRDFGFSGVAIKPYTVNDLSGVLSDLLSDARERT